MTEDNNEEVKQVEGEDAVCPHCSNDDAQKILGAGKPVPLRMCKNCGKDWQFDCSQMRSGPMVEVVNMTGKPIPKEVRKLISRIESGDTTNDDESVLGAIEVLCDGNNMPSPEEMVEKIFEGVPDEIREMIEGTDEGSGFKDFLTETLKKIGGEAGMFGQLSRTNITARGYPWMEEDGTYRKSYDMNRGMPNHEVNYELDRLKAHIAAADGPATFYRWLNDWFSTIFEAWRGLPFRGKEPDHKLFTRRYIEMFRQLDVDSGACDGWEENEILRVEMEDGVTFGVSPETCLQLILSAGMACEALLQGMAGEKPMQQKWTYEDGKNTDAEGDGD